MNIFINKNNYLISYIRLVCFGLSIKLTDREELVLERIAFTKNFSRVDKNKLCRDLNISVYSIANTLKALKTKDLVKRVKVETKSDKKLYGSYYYTCSFSLPQDINQLSESSLKINFIIK